MGKARSNQAAAEFLRPYGDARDALSHYRRLFTGRTDVYAVQQADGSYRPARTPLSDKVLTSHLRGEITIGLYLVRPVEDTCDMAVIDVDNRSRDMVLGLVGAARQLGFQDNEFLLEGSGHKGFHAWIFFEGKTSAEQALKVGKVLSTRAALPDQVEVFPKQAHVPMDGFGNLIKLPGRHRKSGKFSVFFSPDLKPQDLSWLDRIVRIPRQKVMDILSIGPDVRLPKVVPADQRTRTAKLIPCIQKLLLGVPEGKRNLAVFRLATFFKDQGVPADVCHGTMDAWNERNQPPMDTGELRATIVQVYRRNYHGYGCQAPEMQEFCSQDTCPIHRARHRGVCSFPCRNEAPPS